mmetsp:Transcript_45368/g.126249  ORF Transcript_45368/g.126249 Transcript_45368/m.126249 type:complete len:217 (-) Transcript_45368:677-1327(-)
MRKLLGLRCPLGAGQPSLHQDRWQVQWPPGPAQPHVRDVVRQGGRWLPGWLAPRSLQPRRGRWDPHGGPAWLPPVLRQWRRRRSLRRAGGGPPVPVPLRAGVLWAQPAPRQVPVRDHPAGLVLQPGSRRADGGGPGAHRAASTHGGWPCRRVRLLRRGVLRLRLGHLQLRLRAEVGKPRCRGHRLGRQRLPQRLRQLPWILLVSAQLLGWLLGRWW